MHVVYIVPFLSNHTMAIILEILFLVVTVSKSYCINNLPPHDNICDNSLTEICDVNPDQYLTTPQIIRRQGYASESHVIETEDGYLLTLHRIPSAKNGKRGLQPVFLQHGLLSSSTDWVDAGNESLAFVLADAGYDVWLGNSRGNTYSKAHAYLNPSSAQFWNFTWHEMGIYDLPAALHHVTNTTGKEGEIIYIGHSMGTTMFFVYSSMLPTESTKLVKAMVALAPVAYMTHLTSPIRYLSPWANDIQWISRYFGLNEFLPNGKILKFLAYECTLLKYSKEICENIIFIFCGFDKEEFDEKLLPVVFSHAPAGTSTKTVVHYAQEIRNNGDFQMYDYGVDGNLIEYGTQTPPSYNLTNINVPIYMMYGDNDLMVNVIDVFRLSQQLTNVIGKYEVPLARFNHVDFLWARDALTLVYKPLLKVLQPYKN